MAARVRKDDMVEVTSGDHRGAKGKVLRILKDSGRVVIEGVNMVHRHVRRSKKHPQGGRIQKEAPIHVSNVQPIDPKTGRGTRVRFEITGRGKSAVKQRVSIGGSALGEVTRAAKRGRAEKS